MITRELRLQLLTSSRLRSFRACRRQHYYAYELHRRPATEAEALRFGTLFHKGLEAWWRILADPTACSNCPFPEEHEIHGNDADSSCTFEPYDPLVVGLEAMRLAATVETDAFELIRAEELLLGYDMRWRTLAVDDVRAIRVISVEVEFRAPLTNPATGATSRTFELAGKMDVLVEINGEIWIIEHKTTTADIAPGSGYWLRLRIDGQVSMYFAGGRAMGHDIVGCLYDVASRPAHRQKQATLLEARKYTLPKICKAHKLAVRGTDTGPAVVEGCPDCEAPRLYAGQRDTDETPEEFRVRVRAAIAAEPEAYFQRGVVTRTETDEYEHAIDVWQTARNLRDAQLEKSHARNPDACERWGSLCEYFDVCTGAASLDDDTRFKTTRPHQELAAPTPTEGEGSDGNDDDIFT